MVELARSKGWRRGVEVGLGHGLLFAGFLGLGLDMIGVDLGLRPERRAKVEKLGGLVLWMASVDAAANVPDGWADFVFIDAGHSYAAVKADIEAWAPKVSPGGWLGGHDYHPSHMGVMRAVDEAFPQAVKLEGWIWTRA